MAGNLQKGQTIDLCKNEKGESFDLSQVTIGLGWDVKQKEIGFFGKLFGGFQEEKFDLDLIAFLLDSNGKVANLGSDLTFLNDNKVGINGGDIVFFNSMTYPSGTGTSSMLFPEGTSKYTIKKKINQILDKGELIVHLGDNLIGEKGGWKFRAIGEPLHTDNLIDILKIYVN